MSEQPIMALASAFCEMARTSKPNCESSLDAQEFFKEHLMGLGADLRRPQIGQTTDEQRGKIHHAYLDGMTKVLRSLTGTEFQTAAGYDTIMEMIPKDEEGIRRNLRKVAISYGVAIPVGWGGGR